MADLLRGGQPPGSAAARAQNGGSRAGPVPVSTHPAAGVRTPTDVMRARRDREARKKAEQEALQRQKEEEDEMRRAQEQEVATGASATAPQGRSGARYSTTEPPYQQESSLRGTGSQAPISGPGRRQENVGIPTQSGQTRQRAPSAEQGPLRPVASQQQQQQPTAPSTRHEHQTAPEEGPIRVRAPRRTSQQASAAPNPAIPTATTQPPAGGQSSGQRSVFPHAFERWETLSSHWEGLTSYWIRRLQENSNELSREPLNQQMSRQITDLSAAGANLFHAVVELQRLRASSERKFQRWFFETRQEQERAAEAQAELQRQLQEERQQRQSTTNAVSTARAERVKAEELVKEMRRELQISKEEARRAWEELGRREQEERDRTISLRNGEPTLVGGVQVVPMMQGASSRQHSTVQRPPTREGPYAGGPGPTSLGGQAPPRGGQSRVESPGEEPSEEQGYAYDPSSTSTAESDPFEGRSAGADPGYFSRQPARSSTTAVSSAPSPARGYRQTAGGSEMPYYQQGSSAETSIHQPQTTATSNGQHQESYAAGTSSEGGYPGDEEYELDSQGNYRLDSRGQPIIRPYSVNSEEYEAEEMERERAYRQQYAPFSASEQAGASSASAGLSTSRPPPSASTYEHEDPDITPTSESADPESSAAAAAAAAGRDPGVDYSGQGWGAPGATGWERITPRHRHPTRLSDVLEEDERSRRTSPSRGSLISGGGERERGGR